MSRPFPSHPLRAAAAAVVAAVTFAAPAAATAQEAAAQAAAAQAAPAPAPPAAVLPPWLQVHAEQRTRYETIDARYGPSEVGGDQQLAFRSRLQVGLATARAWAFTELQDSRVALDDSASTVTTQHEMGTKVQQFHAGVAWRNVAGRGVALQIEGGRFSRDFGARRLIARNAYRNSTNAIDGAIAQAAGAAWSLQAVWVRPVAYTYPATARDRRFDRSRMGTLYFTSTASPAASADAYVIHWNDGGAMPADARRTLRTVGGRVFGTAGSRRRVEYEAEAAVQRGTVGGRTHRAWFQHAQAGVAWPAAFARPRLLGTWEYGSGDADPADARSGRFDALLGARRFELGPTGIYGLMGRGNVMSPGVWLITRPWTRLEASLQVHDMWLADAHDRWRQGGLWDPTGAAGRHVGEQTEVRLRYRLSAHVELDTAVTRFDEGPFVRALKPSRRGHATHAYAALDVRY